MVSTTDEQVPVLPATEDSFYSPDDEIQKMKDELSKKIDHDGGDDEAEVKENKDDMCDVDEDEHTKMDEGIASTSETTNGNGHTNGDSGEANGIHKSETKNGEAKLEQSSPATFADGTVECIDLDEDDEIEPPAKKTKTEMEPGEVKKTPKTDDKKDTPLDSPEALLNKLEEYIANAIDEKKNVDRKVLDALLGAINVQVQKEPLSVRKLILDKQLVLPNTISFPPSMVVDMLIEHDPEHPLSKVINKMFGDERPKLSDAEKKERQALKVSNPAPHMTKLLMDIGQDLVQEATYCDIVHARNLPETPKNLETYKTVAAQLKPVWEALKKKNEPYKLKLLSCQVCGFKTESRLVLQNHRSRTHYKSGKYQCAMCPEFDTNEQRLLNHYLESHMIIATKEEQQAKYPCLICEEDFQFKGLRDHHMKVCKKDYNKVRHIMAPKASEDTLMINRWLWDRPPIDPTILQQQHAAQAQQKKSIAVAQAAQVAQAQAIRRGAVSSAQAAMMQQQLLQQQQRQNQIRQLGAIMNGRNMNMGMSNPLIQAMQQHLRAAGTLGANQRSPVNAAAAAANLSQQALYQKALANSTPQQKAYLAQQAAAQTALRQKAAMNVQQMQQQVAKAIVPPTPASSGISCEICDVNVADKEKYLSHLQAFHKQLRGKTNSDMQQGAPLACSRCRDRFWSYEGLERHLVMSHGLVTADLLTKAQKKEDGGRCKLCSKQYAFNMLQHLVADHQVKLCSAEIMYSCDVCSFKCSSYHQLESHLSTVHPKAGDKVENGGGASTSSDKKNGDDCITLDD